MKVERIDRVELNDLDLEAAWSLAQEMVLKGVPYPGIKPIDAVRLAAKARRQLAKEATGTFSA